MSHRESIASVGRTAAHLLGGSPIGSPSIGLLPELIEAAGGALPLRRMLLYHPDALGTFLWDRFPEERARVEEAAPIRVSLAAPMPTVTPVCFASMMTGLLPHDHGITAYEKPVLKCATVFDSLSALRKCAIVAVRDSSYDIIFRGRNIAYFSEDYDGEVLARAKQLISEGSYEVIAVYTQAYDDALHRTTPLSPAAIAAFRAQVDIFAGLAQAVAKHWSGVSHLLGFCPDHGAHTGADGRGTHGSDCPEDVQVEHWFGVSRGKNRQEGRFLHRCSGWSG
ncbi:MAG: hypothetical protein WC712_05420 [Candidatus Brocadiia bacterium]